MPHHVTQRGNNRQDVFFVDDDRRAYLRILRLQAEAHGLDVVGYCLMTNHVHVVAVPATEEALAKALGQTHLRYARYINRLHGRSGHLWQNRFYSCALDEPHLWAAVRYVERNPVRAGMVRAAWQYRWSSASAHVGGSDGSDLLNMQAWAAQWDARRWKQELGRPDEAAALTGLRQSTHTGRPLGSDRFLSKLEAALGRRLRPLPVGRPPKRQTPQRADASGRKK